MFNESLTLLPLFHLDYKSSPLHETFTIIEKTWHSISVYLFIYKQISKQCSPAFEDVTAHTGPWYTQTYFKTELSFISIRLIILTDLEVAQLVAFLIRRHHPQPVSQVVLLQVLLCEVLKIPEEHGVVSIYTKTLKRTLIINISLLSQLMYRISPFRELLLWCDADFVLLTRNLH